MSNVKISDMTSAGALSGAELAEVTQSGNTRKVTFSTLAAFVKSSLSLVAGPGSATDAAIALFDGITGKLLKNSAVTISTDGTMAANSDAKLPTEKAIRAYIAAYLAAQDVFVFKGLIDCSSNPNYPAADAGHVYKVSVAGKIGGPSGQNVQAGDTLYCIIDGSVSGPEGSVGANWAIIQVNIDGAVIGPASVTDSHFAQFDGATGKLIKGGIALDTDTALAANSDTKLPSQKAVKAYADNLAVQSICIAASDETTALTVGTGKVTFRMPYAFTVTGVRASLTTAQSGGSIFTVDINEAGASIISTKLTIDNTEKTSTTAATPAVISDSSLADDAEITIDIDQIGDGTAKGLKVYLIGHR